MIARLLIWALSPLLAAVDRALEELPDDRPDETMGA